VVRELRAEAFDQAIGQGHNDEGGPGGPPSSGEYRSRTGDLLHAMQAL
jgi:hypothetical protein